MALNNYEKTDRIRTNLHRTISDIYFHLNGFDVHNARPDINRAWNLFVEAYRTAKKIRNERDRNYMMADLRKDKLAIWDAEDQVKVRLATKRRA